MKRSRPATKIVQCCHTRKGPYLGGNIVAWLAPCRVRFRVPADWSDFQKCHHHRSHDQSDALREALAQV